MASSALPHIGSVKHFDPFDHLFSEDEETSSQFWVFLPCLVFTFGSGGQGITATKHFPVPVLCLLPFPSLHLSHLFGLSQTVNIKLPNLKLTFLSELVLGSSQMCLQRLRSPCGPWSELPGQALQSLGILLEQPSLNIGIFCADKLREVIPSLKERKNNDCDK